MTSALNIDWRSGLANGLRSPLQASRKNWARLRSCLRRDGLVRIRHGLCPCRLDVWWADPGLSRGLIMRRGLHDAAAAVAFRDALAPGATVVEVGANIGYYALLEGCRIGERGKVFALEPRKTNLELLERNIELNRLNDRIQTFHLAASDVSGPTELELSHHSNWHRLAPRLDVSPASRVTQASAKHHEAVQAVALDDFNEQVVAPQGRAIDVVRMDIEGHEVEVVAGMQRLLASGAPLTLFMELHPDIICRERGEQRWQHFVDGLCDQGFAIAAGYRRWHLDPPERVSSWSELRQIRETCLVILTR